MSFAYDLAVTGGGGGSLLPVFVVAYYSTLFLLQYLFLVVLKQGCSPRRRTRLLTMYAHAPHPVLWHHACCAQGDGILTGLVGPTSGRGHFVPLQ